MHFLIKYMKLVAKCCLNWVFFMMTSIIESDAQMQMSKYIMDVNFITLNILEVIFFYIP